MTEIKWRDDLKVDYLQHMGSDEMVARSARVSTGRDKLKQDKIEGLIRYLVKSQHVSTLEHCVLTVRVEAPIFVAREWMRHRTQSFNEISGRYAILPGEFYVPQFERPLENQGTSARPVFEVNFDKQLHRVVTGSQKVAYKEAWQQYEKLVNAGVANEVARNVLPVGIYTKFYATANLNNWFKFLTLRNGDVGSPQYEIAQAAQKVEKIIAELYPITYAAWKASNVV